MTTKKFKRIFFVYFYEVIINYYPNFMTCFYFSLDLGLVQSNSSHCQLMDLFKSKERFKEKVHSDNKWKAIDLSSGFVIKCLSFGPSKLLTKR